MLDTQSAIASTYIAGRLGPENGVTGVTVRERKSRNLIQLSGSRENFSSVCNALSAMLGCDVPADLKRATSSADRVVFRVGPERLWISEPLDAEERLSLDAASLGEGAIITEIGHSRTVLRIRGPEADTLLSRGLPVDLSAGIFPVNSVAQSAIHHIPVLIHRVEIASDTVFDAYVPRDLAMTFWEWLTEAAAPLGCEILKPD